MVCPPSLSLFYAFGSFFTFLFAIFIQQLQDFWDVKSAKLVGSAVAHCAAVCEWAPDSRHFIAAVVSPRIRVDNGYVFIYFLFLYVF
jgi:hypothetical protein